MFVRRKPQAALAAAGVVVAACCLVFVALASRSSTTSLAQFQKLDDLSSEFDPFTDADSNYGRVLSLAHISRTNGPVAEDMDTSGEFKGTLQQLYAMPSQFKDHAPTGEASLPDAGVVGTDRAFLNMKQNKAGQWYEGMEKSRVQMLARPVRFLPGQHKYQTLPDAGAMGTNRAFMNKADGAGQSTKAKMQKLYDIDGPQATDPTYKSWLRAATHDTRAPTAKETLAAQIRAAYPK